MRNEQIEGCTNCWEVFYPENDKHDKVVDSKEFWKIVTGHTVTHNDVIANKVEIITFDSCQKWPNLK